MKKRILSIILAIAMLACMIPMSMVTASAAIFAAKAQAFKIWDGTAVPKDTVCYLFDPSVYSQDALLKDYANSGINFEKKLASGNSITTRTGASAAFQYENNMDVGASYSYYFVAGPITKGDAQGIFVSDLMTGTVSVTTGFTDLIVSSTQYTTNKGIVSKTADKPFTSGGWYFYHTHTKGNEYMTDGRAHWLKCADADCPLKTVEDYEMAFSSYEGPELKELLDYSETCHTNGADTTSMLMGRQGKYDKDSKAVSNTDGRTIIGLTQSDLDKIGNKLVIVGCDDSDSNKQVSVDVDCAYTWFYDVDAQTGNAVKVEAKDCGCDAFVIIDSSLVGSEITGFGYYRVYNDTVSDSNLIGEALYKAPRTYKAVLDNENKLNFYYDTIDHSNEGTLYDNLPVKVTVRNQWSYYSIRESVKGVAIHPTVIKYKDLKCTAWMFFGMRFAESFSGAEYLDVSGVTNMQSMFEVYGSGRTNALSAIKDVPDVSRWNTANVTNMNGLFSGYGQYATGISKAPDVSNWNTANVTDMGSVFSAYVAGNEKANIFTNLSEVPDVSNWNTAKAKNILRAFEQYGQFSSVLNFTLDLSRWDVSSVTYDGEIYSGDTYYTVVTNAGKTAVAWKVTIPAKTGDKDNDGTHWYVGDGTDKYITLDPSFDGDRSFTLAQ